MSLDACHHSNGSDFWAKLGKAAIENRVPLNGTIELSSRCNLRCAHCFHGSEKVSMSSRTDELSISQWKKIVDMIVEAGCIELTITGGEPMIHPEFCDIYSYACARGLLLNVFTNATLVNDKVLDIFDKYPPRRIEISVYGATEKTYERVTGVRGSFIRCMDGIHLLQKRGHRLTLKTVMNSLNQHEVQAIEMLAAKYGAHFRFDGQIFPRFNDGLEPFEYHSAPEEIFRQQTLNPQWVKEIQTAWKNGEGSRAGEGLFFCGAGKTGFYVDAEGMLRPCIMASGYRFDLLTGDFQRGWKAVGEYVNQSSSTVLDHCKSCDKRILCGLCCGVADRLGDSFGEIKEILCRTGELRQSLMTE